MLRGTDQSIFDSQSPVLVNPVNCVGVMGAGLALSFKQRFPQIDAPYRKACETGELAIGRPLWISVGTRWIVCLPTKDDWRQPSTLPYVRLALRGLVIGMRERHLTSVALPAIGCGLGGLSWDDVQLEIRQAFEGSDATVWVHPPKGRRWEKGEGCDLTSTTS